MNLYVNDRRDFQATLANDVALLRNELTVSYQPAKSSKKTSRKAFCGIPAAEKQKKTDCCRMNQCTA
ncbi:MAG: hypothetical protein PHI98_12245 [Eubacteriales bacterium]|nr:hypothetical protein [Eubacteriales bacterium]